MSVSLSDLFLDSLHILLLNLHIFIPLGGLKYLYFFNDHLYANSFQISVSILACFPRAQTQISEFLPYEQNLTSNVVNAAGIFIDRQYKNVSLM